MAESSKPWLKKYDPGVPRSLKFPDQPLYYFLEESAKRYPEHVCLSYQGIDFSYRQVLAEVNQTAAGLLSLGLRKGERVGLLLPNNPEFVISFYAILKAGGIVVALNPQYKPRELESLIRDAGVRILIGLKEMDEILRGLQEQTGFESLILTGTKESIAQVETDNLISIGQTYSWQDLIGSNSKLPFPSVTSSDPAVFQYTGGTTGTPKAAIGLHRNLVANTIQFRAWLRPLQEGREVVLAAIPLFHVYGMVIAMSLGIALGSRLVLVSNPRDVQEILNTIQTYRVTVYPGVPSMYHAINLHPDVIAGKYDLSSIKACISGSAPLLKEIKDRFETLTGGQLMEGYGLSEAPTATHCNPMLGENRTGSIGLPLPDVDCKIVSLEDGIREVAVGEIGELILRSPQVMQGYHQMEEETANVLRNGWLFTGDIARMDSDGYFYLVDRKKDLIKVGGLQAWPREIEEALARHPKVREAAAAGIPDLAKGEVVMAWVVPKSGEKLLAGELIDWCRQWITGYKVPVDIEFRTELPRTSVGKILRRQLVQEFMQKRIK